VLLASRRSCHGEGPWYLQQGDHHYRFSLTSHAPGWQHGQRQGIEANAPLLPVVDPPKDLQPRLPESMSFVSLDADNVVLSTIKKSEDDDAVIVRMYESAGRPANGSINVFTPILKAEETTLIEDDGKGIAHERNRVMFRLGHNSISTFKITPMW
jgi:alpha-mannosidase